MTYEIKPYYWTPCELEVFTINGIDACVEDFGDREDGRYEDPWDEDAEQHVCYNWKFITYETPRFELSKYNITLEDYNEICDVLKSILHISCCDRCF